MLYDRALGATAGRRIGSEDERAGTSSQDPQATLAPDLIKVYLNCVAALAADLLVNSQTPHAEQFR